MEATFSRPLELNIPKHSTHCIFKFTYIGVVWGVNIVGILSHKDRSLERACSQKLKSKTCKKSTVSPKVKVKKMSMCPDPAFLTVIFPTFVFDCFKWLTCFRLFVRLF